MAAKPRRWIATLTVLALTSAGTTGVTLAGSASPSGSPDGDLAGAVRTILEDAGFSGSVLVLREGDLIYRGAMGLADAARGLENTPETLFKIGSIDKQLLAGFVLTLAQDGLIDLQGSLCQGIDGCPESLEDVTYHQVLTHTSGIPDMTDEELASIRSNEDALRVIGDAERLFAPGEGWAYSTTAYSLLTATPEMLLERGLIESRSERVFVPADMPSTGLAGFEGPVPGAATGYDQPGGMALDQPIGNWSNVDDLWAWHRALLAAAPISEPMVELMETRHAEVEPGLWYGYGVELRDTDGHREVSHRGGTAGFVSQLVRFPDEDTLIVILSNVESTDVDALKAALVAAVLPSS